MQNGTDSGATGGVGTPRVNLVDRRRFLARRGGTWRGDRFAFRPGPGDGRRTAAEVWKLARAAWRRRGRPGQGPASPKRDQGVPTRRRGLASAS